MIRTLFFLGGLLVATLPNFSLAQTVEAVGEDSANYLARIEVHTSAELIGLLRRAETLFQAGRLETSEPVVFVLHGSEGRAFLREAYPQNKQLVDLAARLSALNVVDIKVCETWMRGQRLEKAQLLPFVSTVPNGPAEVSRLLADEHYLYF